MANHVTIRHGIDSTALYKEEVTYNTDPGTWTTGTNHFGITQAVTPSLSRNLIKLRGLSGVLPADNQTATSRDALQIKAGKSDLTVSVEYQPQEFSFLKYVMGSVSGTTTDINYPQATASTETDKRKYVKLPSIAMVERLDFEGVGTDDKNTALKMLGLKVDTWEITGAIGEPVKCSTTLNGGNVLIDDTSISTNVPYKALSSEDVYHFVNCDIKIGASSIPNLLDGFTLTIGNGLQGLGDLRSYVNEAQIPKERNISLKIDMTLENMTYLKQRLGATDGIAAPGVIDEITIVLDKGDGKNLYIYLLNSKQADGLPGGTYGDVLKETLNLECELAYFVENKSA